MKLLAMMLLGAAISFGAVDINKADKDELMSILGVGSKRADSIIEYRNKHNCFKKIQELKDVNGFGDKFIEKNKKSIIIGECKKR